uniref:Uncharacterized protein n=1 Tax=Arundo donax TaxID=35708 RepID=A0A0A9AG82_ARUDO
MITVRSSAVATRSTTAAKPRNSTSSASASFW